MNQNGCVVLEAINKMGKPATIANIVDYISSMEGHEPNEDLKDCVKETVQGGVRYGYVQKKNRKYFSAPLNFGSGVEESNEASEASDNASVSGVPEDRMRRRRRSTSRSRSRGGRAVRRRRSRSSRR